MSWFTRIRNVFRAEKLSADLDDELRFHIAERVDELVAGGMTEDEARRIAARSFGNYTVQKERTRDADVAGWIDALGRDLRHAARQLRLNPGFAAVAILSLALGIGANSAIFQLINAIRFRGLPVDHPEALAAIDTDPGFVASGWRVGRHTNFTYAVLEQIEIRQQAFSAVMAFGTGRFNMSRGGEARYAEGLLATPNFLEVLGVTPAIGSWHSGATAADDCSEAGALLDYGFWQREFGGDAAAVGQSISLNGHSFPILGVAPRSFTGPEPARRFDVVIPICADGILAGGGRGRLALKAAWWLTPIGRLKPGWTVERASAHLGDISPSIFQASLPEDYRPDVAEGFLANRLRAVSARAGVSSVRRGYESPLWILFAITGLVLLIACANLANLLLARASAREREVALRQAIGASRGRLVRQLMTESFLLAGLGALLGAGLAHLLGRGLVSFLTSGEQQLHVPLGVDWRVFGFLAALALLTCVLFGLAPALRATEIAPAAGMRGGRGSVAGSERHGLRRGLVVAQIGLSFVLLVAALLFGRSLRNLLQTDTGFASEGILVATITAGAQVDPERRGDIYTQLGERLNRLPGVASAAPIRFAPFSGNGWNEGVYTDAGGARVGTVWLNRTGPGYLETMRTSLLAGRDFETWDRPGGPNVAIVNEEFARLLFAGADPVGRTFRYEANAEEADPLFEIVGLVENTKYNGLRETTRPIALLPVAQDESAPETLSFVVRVGGPAAGVMAGVREQMAQIDPRLLVEFRMLDAEVERSVLRERLMANLSGGFGLLAALLSTLGLYGVMSFMVARRRNEIGVRLALGAGGGHILGLIMREAGVLLLIGLAVGLAGSFALSRYAESLLFGLQGNDVASLVLGGALLGATGIAAALVPANRAARLNPAEVMKDG
jgi:predicted permease